MTSTDPVPPTPATLPVPEKYRAVVYGAMGVVVAGLIALADTLEAEQFGGVSAVTVAVAALTALGVYFPANPWAKLAAAVAGTAGVFLVESLGDGLTYGEMITTAVMAFGAVNVGTRPNPRAIVDGKLRSVAAAPPYSPAS